MTTLRTSTSHADSKNDAILKLGRNRRLAHATLFRHRHTDDTPAFHYEIIDAWHSPVPRVLTQAFRGGAKSTIAEEVIAIEACFNLFSFAMLLGDSRDRAIERLRAIKYELEYNDYIHSLFGNLVGAVWNEDEVVLANGARITAFGMEQSLRGVKHYHARPDRLYCDDMESEETTKTPEARAAFAAKFTRVVLPLLDPKARIRILGTPLERDAFIVRLSRLPAQWRTQKFPIEYKDATTGERVATWPSRFPLQAISDIKESYRALGQLQSFMQEYMLEPEDIAMKKFHESMFTVAPIVHTWQPTMAVYDPARTVNINTSATTGHVVGSWVGAKLHLWEGDGRFLLPDAIISDMFRVQETYHPIAIGVEADGLNEFIMQPLRHEQTRRRAILPIKALKAPKGKLSFIESLQPFFKGGDIVFCGELPELKRQLLGFPTDRMDAPNALAYLLVMRPGIPMYENFNHMNVIDDNRALRGSPVWLAVNVDKGHFTAVACQFIDGAVRVLYDWVREGDAAVFGEIYSEAALLFPPSLRVVAAPRHWLGYDTVGLLPAIRKHNVAPTQGGVEVNGREELRQRMRMTLHNQPAVLVSQEAAWTLNAFSGGYCRAVQKTGMASEIAEEGYYRTLMEGLESFAALLQTVRDDGMDTPNYAVSASGVRHLTALPAGREHGRQRG